MDYLLVDLDTGRILSEHGSREQALDEVLDEIDANGEETVDTLALMWFGRGTQWGSVGGGDLLGLARSRARSS